MFGVDHQLRAGLADPIEDEVVTFTIRRALGSLPGGATLRFRAAGNEHSRSYLPVRPDGAEVLATDGHGRPALLLRRIGAGSIVLCTYPVEHMAAVTPRVNPEATSSLYDALADHAGVRRTVVVRDALVAADVLVRSDGQRFACLVSQADTAVTVTPELADGLALAALEATGRASCDRGTVTLGPYGAGVFLLVSAAR